MNSIFEKLFIMFKLNNLYENLKKRESVVNNLNINNNVNQISNNLVRMLNIGAKYNAIDVNEDKQRQCYKQWKCFWPKCRYSCDYESQLNEHISRHLNKKQFVCEECNKDFNSNSHLIKHKRYVHSTGRPFVCNQIGCNKTFKTKSDLIKHHIKHSSVKSIGCDKCDKRFKNNQLLLKHKQWIHLNIRRFVCPQNYCKQRFKRKKDLNDHKGTHSPDKPFKCEECDKRFKLISVMISHKNCHTIDRKFKCDFEGCDRRFKQRSGLYNHKQRTHIGIKRHKCLNNNCDKSFITSAELKTHIAYNHSTDRPFKCNFQICNSTFKSSTNLNNHVRLVHLKNNK